MTSIRGGFACALSCLHAPYTVTAANTMLTTLRSATLTTGVEEAARHRADIDLLTDEQKTRYAGWARTSLAANSIRTYDSDRWCSPSGWNTRILAPRISMIQLATWPQCIAWLESMIDAGLSEATLRRRFSSLRTHVCPSLKLPDVELANIEALHGALKASHDDGEKGKRRIMVESWSASSRPSTVEREVRKALTWNSGAPSSSLVTPRPYGAVSFNGCSGSTSCAHRSQRDGRGVEDG